MVNVLGVPRLTAATSERAVVARERRERARSICQKTTTTGIESDDVGVPVVCAMGAVPRGP